MSHLYFPPQVWQLWGVPAREAEEGGVPPGLREAGVWKGRAEREAKAKSNSESLPSHFLYLPIFFLCAWLHVFPADADKRTHAITAVAHVQNPANARKPPTDTHAHYLGWNSLQPSAMCHSVSSERIHTKWVTEWFRRQALPLYLRVVYF